jgi:hypothetical protein
VYDFLHPVRKNKKASVIKIGFINTGAKLSKKRKDPPCGRSFQRTEWNTNSSD